MSTQETKDHQPSEDVVSFNDAINFFADVGVNVVCPTCGKNDGWSVVAGAAGNIRYPGLATVNSLGQILITNGTPVITTTCNNCGFMRFHAASVVLSRIKELKNKPAEENKKSIVEMLLDINETLKSEESIDEKLEQIDKLESIIDKINIDSDEKKAAVDSIRDKISSIRATVEGQTSLSEGLEILKGGDANSANGDDSTRR